MQAQKTCTEGESLIPHPRSQGLHSPKLMSFSFSFGCHSTFTSLGACHCPPTTLSLFIAKLFSPHGSIFHSQFWGQKRAEATLIFLDCPCRTHPSPHLLNTQLYPSCHQTCWLRIQCPLCPPPLSSCCITWTLSGTKDTRL